MLINHLGFLYGIIFVVTVVIQSGYLTHPISRRVNSHRMISYHDKQGTIIVLGWIQLPLGTMKDLVIKVKHSCSPCGSIILASHSSILSPQTCPRQIFYSQPQPSLEAIVRYRSSKQTRPTVYEKRC